MRYTFSQKTSIYGYGDGGHIDPEATPALYSDR